MSLLVVDGLSRSFGGVRAVRDVDLRIDQGETLGIIGPNGAGKTTLFNLVTGTDSPERGTIRLDGRDITRLGPDARARLGIIRTFQHGRAFASLSVLENMLLGAHGRRKAARHAAFGLVGLAELAQAFFPWGSARGEEADLRREAGTLLSRFGERLLPRLHEPVYSLSYANRRRVEIARALFARPRILFLDEPTAGMNPAETLEMVAFLAELKGQGQTMVVIEHKLPLVLPLSDRVVVMDEGRKIAEGDPLTISARPEVVEAYLGRRGSATIDDEEAKGERVDPPIELAVR